MKIIKYIFATLLLLMFPSVNWSMIGGLGLENYMNVEQVKTDDEKLELINPAPIEEKKKAIKKNAEIMYKPKKMNISYAEQIVSNNDVAKKTTLENIEDEVIFEVVDSDTAINDDVMNNIGFVKEDIPKVVVREERKNYNNIPKQSIASVKGENISTIIKTDKNTNSIIIKNNNSDMRNRNDKFAKIRTDLTANDHVQINYNKAIKLIKTGDIPGAMVMLTVILERNPDFHLARLQLIDLQRQNGNEYEVEALLNDGLRIDKYNSNYIKQKASLLLEREQYTLALEVLLIMPANKHNDIEYQGMLALAYYQQKMYTMAKSIYSGLLSSGKPQQSQWWLGLAICHDALGEDERAIISFSKVRTLGYIGSEVIKYVDRRIEHIKTKKKT